MCLSDFIKNAGLRAENEGLLSQLAQAEQGRINAAQEIATLKARLVEAEGVVGSLLDHRRLMADAYIRARAYRLKFPKEGE